MQIYQIKNFEDYELHYSKDEQLIYSKKNEKYLKLCKNRDGYLQIHLCKNGKQKWITLHRLVWQCLKGDIPKGYEINHIDENKENNSIENLELLTHKENNNFGTRTERAAKTLTNRHDLSKAIIGLKKDLLEILHYSSIRETERVAEKGFDNRNISKCCLNKIKSAYGYYWFFKDDFEKYMKQFNNDLEKVIEYKLSLFNKKKHI